LVLGDNANIENNSGVIMRELESVVPASATTLVLPIYRYPAQLGDQVALAEEIRGDLGAYPGHYRDILLPILPDNGRFNDGVRIAAAALGAQQAYPNVRVAIPGFAGQRTPVDVLRANIFASAMRDRMAAAQGRP
jgi:hypothetical protein